MKALWTAVILTLAAFYTSASAEEFVRQPSSGFAAPNPPLLFQTSRSPQVKHTIDLKTAVLYSIGNPTDEEQLYVEFINRARRDPAGEGIRLRDTDDQDILSSYDFFDTRADIFASSVATTNPTPPLSINAKLTTAARLHSLDMFNNIFQEHVGSDGRNIVARVEAQNFTQWRNLGENIFLNAESVYHGHAGFEVDWGNDLNGMQEPPGHRQTIHNPQMREIGVGVVLGHKQDLQGLDFAGPQVVTQDFGTLQSNSNFLTGVVFYELGTNQFYDIGEGLSGIIISVEGASFSAISTNSGGYSVPLRGNGTYKVHFTWKGTVLKDETFTISANENFKIDLLIPYLPSTTSGPATIPNQITTSFDLLALAGVTEHRVQVSRPIPFTKVEGGETEMTNFTAETVGYEVRQNTIKASGSFGFRLTSTNTALQTLTYKPRLLLSNSSQARFKGRLANATEDQTISFQISTNGGSHWVTLWQKRGKPNLGEASFTEIIRPLAEFANTVSQFRFVFRTDGSFFQSSNPGLGFYFDDLTFTSSQQLIAADFFSTTEPVINLKPDELGDYVLESQAVSGKRLLPGGIPKLVTVTETAVVTPTPPILERIQPGPSGTIEIIFSHPTAPMAKLELQSREKHFVTWQRQNVVIEPTPTGGKFRIQIPASDPQRFFRMALLP